MPEPIHPRGSDDHQRLADEWWERHGEYPLLLLGHSDGRRYWCLDHNPPATANAHPVWAADDRAEEARCCMCARWLRHADGFGDRNQATEAVTPASR